MLIHILTALAALLFSNAVAHPSWGWELVAVCDQSPYSSLECLKGNALAQSACAALQPAATTTTTLSTTTLSVATVTQTTSASSQSTVTSVTNGAAGTVTVTATFSSTATNDGSGTTSFSIATVTDMTSTTVTTFVSTSATSTTAAAKRQASCSAGIIATLEGLSSSQAVTACSCIGYPRSTVTATATDTFASLSTTTVYVGQPAVTTVASLTDSTVTVTVGSPASSQSIITTQTMTQTNSVTATSTVSMAAPTYTLVFGPKAGCSDLDSYNAENLDPAITVRSTAVAECKAWCTQNGDCASLYVQKMFPDYGETIGYFTCYMHKNATGLVDGVDLDCGQDKGIYGVAVGFEALGRGSTPLSKRYHY